MRLHRTWGLDLVRVGQGGPGKLPEEVIPGLKAEGKGMRKSIPGRGKHV